MGEQKFTYSTYRGMTSFTALIGIAPNAVITHVSKLFPGSVSDAAIVAGCGVLEQFTPGDLILADNGFLIADVVPTGVSVNIPPFLYNGKFNEGESKNTKTIAQCRSFVVDDLCTRARTVEEATELHDKAKSRMQEGGFTLRKWKSNNKEVRKDVGCREEHLQAKGSEMESSECEETYAKETLNKVEEVVNGNETKVLGLTWLLDSDELVLRLDSIGKISGAGN